VPSNSGAGGDKKKETKKGGFEGTDNDKTTIGLSESLYIASMELIREIKEYSGLSRTIRMA